MELEGYLSFIMQKFSHANQIRLNKWLNNILPVLYVQAVLIHFI